jgi:hypothetical protein
MPTLRDAFDTFVWIVGKLGWGWGTSFVLFLVVIFLSYRLWKTPRPHMQFFDTRASLDKNRGGIGRELENNGEVFWVMWQVGHLMTQIAPGARRKIQRMILGNPRANEDILNRWATTAGAGTAENIRSRIIDATRLASEVGTSIRWNYEQSVSLVIANPSNTNNSGWIRIEFIAPFLLPTSRPSLVILQKDYPGLFSTFVLTYEKVWNDSMEPS